MPDVLIEEAAELALAHAQAVGEPLDRCAGAVECALCDARHGATDGACGAAPCRRLRRCFRTATEAGAEAGLLCRRSAHKKTAMLTHRRARGADGAAVDASRGDGSEEAAIEAGIAGLQRAIADVGIERDRIELCHIEQGRIQQAWVDKGRMSEYRVHHLLSVLLRGALCLAIFGRDGNAVSMAMESGDQGRWRAHLNEYAARIRNHNISGVHKARQSAKHALESDTTHGQSSGLRQRNTGQSVSLLVGGDVRSVLHAGFEVRL
jgi:hypothetical protein